MNQPAAAPSRTDATTADEVAGRVKAAFLLLTLEFGGIAAEHNLDAVVTERMSNSIETALRDCLEPLESLRAPKPMVGANLNLRPYPAIVRLLGVIRDTQ
ncbi:MAG: hypothetical protein WC326_02110 [Candidatus Delongbacteria bacterium]